MLSPAAPASSIGEPALQFRLDAGVVDLDIAVYGALQDHHRRLVDWQLREFVRGAPPDPSRARIECRFELAGPGPVELVGAHTITPRSIAVGAATYVEWPYYRAVFGDERADVVLSSEPVGLDHAIRGATVFGTMPQRALYFHGASLVFGEQAILFVGPSGAGKSTVAREGGADRAVCDEISIVDGGSRWRVLPSPFWGTLGYAHYRAGAPLAAIATLSHGSGSTEWREVHGMSRLARLLPHVGAQSPTQLADARLLARLTQLVTDLHVYDVAWVRGEPVLQGSPWKRSR